MALRPARVTWSVLALALALTAAACSGGGSSEHEKPPAHARVSITPADGATSVSTARKVTVRARGGTLTSVDVRAPSPGALRGTFSRDHRTWTATAKPAPGVRYAVTVRAKGEDGRKTVEKAGFTTAEPPASAAFVGEYYPDKGMTVGTAMPVSILFNKPVRDKAAVERKLSVTASPEVDGSWSWIKDRNGKDRIDYRPRDFWKPGTDVTLRMRLDGVAAGGGRYGTQDRTVRFHVGSSLESTLNVRTKTLTVTRDGKELRKLPVSSGKPGYETWNGTMVVLSKVPTIRMNSRTVGIFGPEAYDLGSVKWDIQLTPSGTYVHAAPWNAGRFGKVNASHGCIGMSPSDAKWFYGKVKTGDPVTVVHSKDTVAVNNGYGDWNLSWSEWRAGSALH